jgi:hypothetical protein
VVSVQFFRTGNQPIRTFGPFPWLRLDATALHAGPDGEEVARYHGGVWSSGEMSAPKYIIHGSTGTLRFEDNKAGDSAKLGPFDQVEVVDGAVYSRPDRQLIARLDEENAAWYTYEDKRFWPSLVISECACPQS